jgi:nitrogen fixation-related uncharacterized protein
VTVLAHCGTYWYYCDGASVAAGLLFLLVIWWSMRRSQRRARERAAARALERALNELAPRHEDRERS